MSRWGNTRKKVNKIDQEWGGVFCQKIAEIEETLHLRTVVSLFIDENTRRFMLLRNLQNDKRWQRCEIQCHFRAKHNAKHCCSHLNIDFSRHSKKEDVLTQIYTKNYPDLSCDCHVLFSLFFINFSFIPTASKNQDDFFSDKVNRYR